MTVLRRSGVAAAGRNAISSRTGITCAAARADVPYGILQVSGSHRLNEQRPNVWAACASTDYDESTSGSPATRVNGRFTAALRAVNLGVKVDPFPVPARASDGTCPQGDGAAVPGNHSFSEFLNLPGNLSVRLLVRE